MPHIEPVLELAKKSDKEIAGVLSKYGIALTAEEAKKIVKLLGRNPTLTEATLWGIQGSEHSSYKSSKRHLQMLPTSGPNVILGPSEDAGIAEIAREPGKRGRKFGIVVSHESHNHPSQVVPFEGAATGIGGCVRDVACMGATVIASADGLRFGDLKKDRSAYIANEVIAGIGGYGNPIGVPNIAGDTYFNPSFNENCLVNVVTLGVLAEDEIIHSRAPQGAGERGYEIILVGKATDMSGMGGASLASAHLDDADRERNKAAVQEPDPFLKRHVLQSTYKLFEILKAKGWIEKVGFKDLGAGGIMCATVEMAAAGGYGAEIDLEKVPLSTPGLPAHVIACSETQERFCWIVPKDASKLVLKHYNETWDLPSVANGAGAAVIGKITKGGQYVLRFGGAKVVDAKATAITQGLSYNRPVKPRRKAFREPKLPLPRDLNKTLLELLSHENIACKMPVYESYDKNVQGISVIEAGEADAGVIAPLRNRTDVQDELKHVGIALSLDANPRYGEISSYWQAANAVVEGCRNVAAVGATPWCITDCLNYGSPEDPVQMGEFVEGVRGISDALKGIGLRLKEEPTEKIKPEKGKKSKKSKSESVPLPCISGNVSFYNLSKNGAIAPQALIATVGRLEHADRAITHKLKASGNLLFLIGPRKNELGGSAYYDCAGELGANIPQPDFANARKEIDLVTDLIHAGLAESCHDISDGGVAVAVSEMALGGGGSGVFGAKIDISGIEARGPATKGKKFKPAMRSDVKLFSETGGFVLEIQRSHMKAARRMAQAAGVPLIKLGFTIRKRNFIVFDMGKEIISLKLSALRTRWLSGLRAQL